MALGLIYGWRLSKLNQGRSRKYYLPHSRLRTRKWNLCERKAHPAAHTIFPVKTSWLCQICRSAARLAYLMRLKDPGAVPAAALIWNNAARKPRKGFVWLLPAHKYIGPETF